MEEWRVIAECPAYEVSNLGRIRHGERILRPGRSTSGYLQVYLCDKGAKRMRLIHRLVAEAFLGEPAGREVDHINRIKTDNRFENLRYCTRQENMANVDYKPGVTGQLYITKVGERFRFRVKSSRLKVSRYFETLEEAMKYRDEVLA